MGLKPWIILVIILALVGRCLGLSGARFVDLDEYRALSFDIDHTALFRLIYSNVAELIGPGHESSFWLSILFSAFALFVVFWLAKKETNTTDGALLITAIFSISPILDCYARSAYPVSLATLLLCIALYFWKVAAFEGRAKWFALACFGATCAGLMLAYLGWYPVGVALLAVAVVYPFNQEKIILRCCTIFASFGLVYLVGATILAGVKHESLADWFTTLNSIRHWGETFVPDSPFTVTIGELGSILFKEALTLCGAAVLALALRRSVQLSTFNKAIFLAGGLALFLAIIPATLGSNTLYERNLVGQFILLLLGFCLAAASGVARAPNDQRKLVRVAIIAALLVGLSNSYASRRELLKVAPIVNWLKSQPLPAEAISLLDLNLRDSPVVLSIPHLEYEIPSRPRVVDWGAIEQLITVQPKVKYIVLTDYYQLKMSGKREVLIWNGLKPVAKFRHPVTGEGGIRVFDVRAALGFGG